MSGSGHQNLWTDHYFPGGSGGGGGGGQDEKFSSANSFVLIYPPLYFKSTFTKTFFLTMSGDLLKRGNINFFFRQKEKRKRNRAVDD